MNQILNCEARDKLKSGRVSVGISPLPYITQEYCCPGSLFAMWVLICQIARNPSSETVRGYVHSSINQGKGSNRWLALPSQIVILDHE